MSIVRGSGPVSSPSGEEIQAATVRRRDETLRRWGMRSWMFVGIALGATVVAGMFGAISGRLVPLVVAVVGGVLSVPVVDRLERVVIFGSTIVGGATLGLLGAALSTPAVAIMVRVGRRPAEARASVETGQRSDESREGNDGR